MSEKFNRAVRSLCGAHRHGHEGKLTDADLLEAFLLRRDEHAFEALVRRHGSMVLGVCRRTLGDTHDAEDAFQATFLVLVQTAGRPFGPGGLWARGCTVWPVAQASKCGHGLRADRPGSAARRTSPNGGSEPMTPTDDWPAVLVEEGDRREASREGYRAPRRPLRTPRGLPARSGAGARTRGGDAVESIGRRSQKNDPHEVSQTRVRTVRGCADHCGFVDRGRRSRTASAGHGESGRRNGGRRYVNGSGLSHGS